jgi:L,D-peptidoglycan transpeptidase YkuD (ErfK/YbiS/YcfS/YnhG family)
MTGRVAGGMTCLALLGMGAGAWSLVHHEETVASAFERAAHHAAAVLDALHLAHRHDAAMTAVVEQTEAAVALAADLARLIPLPPRERRHLVRSRLALAEAQALRRIGDDDAARAAAIDALTAAQQATLAAGALAARYTDSATTRRWQQWTDQTIEWSRRTGRPAVLISKADRHVALYVAGRRTRVFPAEFGPNWIAAKLQAGDEATPEGRYRIVARNSRSQFYKAMLLDYPNAEDQAAFARARRAGRVAADAAPGGLIEIHGAGGRNADWTRGCIAMSNRDIDILFDLVSVGTPVTIVGAHAPIELGRASRRAAESDVHSGR